MSPKSCLFALPLAAALMLAAGPVFADEDVTEFDLSDILGDAEEEAAPAAPVFDHGAESIRVAQDFLRGNAVRVRRRFDEAMLAALSELQLNTLAAQIGAGAGAVKDTGMPIISDAPGGHKVVIVPVMLERANVDVQVTWTLDEAATPPTHRISGLFVRPSSAREAANRMPPYVDRANYVESDVTVDGLPGRLAIPISAVPGLPGPAVVLVHGSGPNDMDGTVGPNKPLRDIALGLSSAGVTTLRYHKRTLQAPDTLGDLATLTAHREVVPDVLAAIGILRARPEVDPNRIFVLGHSLGALMAPEIAREDGRLAGIALVGAPARSGAEDAIDQIDHIRRVQGGALPPSALVQMERLRRSLQAVVDGTAPDSENVLGASAFYWRDVAKIDAAATVRALDPLPVFVALGGRDYQVPPAKHLAAWREVLDGRPFSRVDVYADLNHLMIPGEGESSPQEYEVPGFVSKQLIVDLAAWMTATPPRRAE